MNKIACYFILLKFILCFLKQKIHNKYTLYLTVQIAIKLLSGLKSKTGKEFSKLQMAIPIL